jgi:integrase
MNTFPCSSFDPARLRTHLSTCPACQSNRQGLIDFAIEILFAGSSGRAPDIRAARVLIINHQSTPAVSAATTSMSDSPVFKDFVKMRFLPDVARHLKPSGRKNYAYLLYRHVLPVIGAFRLKDITFEMIQDGLIQTMLDAGYAVQTVKHVRTVTSAVFNHAIRTRNFLGTKPTFGVRLPQMKRKPKHALTVPQAKAVLGALKSPYRAMALVSLTTSMNLAEMCALRWKRLNLSPEPILLDGEIIPAHSVAVRENFYQGNFGTPKTINRRRCVALPQAAVAELKLLKQTTRFAGPDDIVFATRRGTPGHASNLRRRIIKPVGKVLGIPWLNWNCFRNTFATLGEQLGIALSDRQAQMGHGTVWMTQEYTVSDIDRRRAGAERIARSIA